MRLRVYRWEPGESAGRFQEFALSPGACVTVLDALVDVREREVPDLAFRYACRVGMCGSCAVVVNGRERWACRTPLAALRSSVVTVRPLYHLPLVRDLVVDMRPFVERMQAAGGAFVAAAASSAGPGGEAAEETSCDSARDSVLEREAIDPAIECIGCGACLSACTMVRWDPRFPGPAALNRAFTLLMDSRDRGGPSRDERLYGEDGVFRCHGQGQCSAVCPMELSPADSILRLRRRAVRSLFSRG
jgi:fumarate reductase iron-sulfur subunit